MTHLKRRDTTPNAFDLVINVDFHTSLGCSDLTFDFIIDNQTYLVEVRVGQLTKSR